MNIIDRIYGLKECEITLSNNLPHVPYLPSEMNPALLASNYFISSWVKHSELNDLKLFDDKLTDLRMKDIERDTKWQPVTHVIVFNIELKEIYLVSIQTIRFLISNYRGNTYNVLKKTFGKWIDIYIPRSVWWKSLIMLEKKYDLENFEKYLNNHN